MRLFNLLTFLLCVSLSAFSQDHISLAKSHLISNSQLKPILKTENLTVSSSHRSMQSGLTHIYFNQTANGIKIYNAITNVAVNDSGEIIFVGNKFINYTSINSVQNTIDSKVALQSVADHFNMKLEAQTHITKQQTNASKETVLQNSSLSNRDINATLVYIQQHDKLMLCWSIAIEKADDNFWWDVKVNAIDGTIIEKTSWTVECNFSHDNRSCDHSSHSHAVSSNTTNILDHNKSKSTDLLDGDYNVVAMPVESPSHGPLSIVNSPWTDNVDPAAHPFDWHNDGTTTHHTTRGNNVWAVEDIDANNNQNTGFSPMSQVGFLGQEYNFIPDFTDNPKNYQDAAITNLFYWNNITHDVMFHYGFDEASGNFQETNNSGAPGPSDAVQADAQDGSDTNNANFSTPIDGMKPRMQMFEWIQSAGSTFSVLTPYTASYPVVAASFGPNATFSGTVVEANDTNGGTHEACNINPISNGAALNGNIALIDRGNCTFVEKVNNAENAGAIAVVICNNVPGAPVGMSGNGTNIPTVMISQADCVTLRASLPATIDVVTQTSAPPNKDSDYDNGIIVHEYGHGISIRLTGGRLNSGCLSNSEQMGEGWSDYFGLILTMKSSDTGPQGRGVGTYVLNEPTTGNGIRPFPYSNDFNVNPMTYQSTISAAIPHGVGSVWCTMLWDMTWELIDRYGIGTNIYDSDIGNAGTPANPGTFGGQNLALQLVIEALKLQPCSPGFVDGRDAILAADQALYGSRHKTEIWNAFAKRGLGVSADQGSTGNNADNVEAFDKPSITIKKTANQLISNNGAVTSFDILVTADCELQRNIEIKDVLDPVFTITSVVCPITPLNIISASYTTVGNNLSITYPLLPQGSSLGCTVSVTINSGVADTITNLFSDDAESGPGLWTIDNFGGATAGEWTIVNSASQSPSNSWFVSNTNGPDKTTAIVSPSLSLSNYPILSFYHQYDTETSWDGGYIEIKKVSDANWSKINNSEFILNGYNGSLGASSNNIIANEEAWTGNSGGFIQSVVKLTQWANEDVMIRLVYGQDNNTNNSGWWIDDISVDNGYIPILNTACVSSDQSPTSKCDDAEILVGLACPIGSRSLTGLQSTSIDIEADGSIDSDQFISGGINVDYDSGTDISLKSGFEVIRTTVFHAFIDGCGGAQ